jgi:transglutaminase-like putative cysteine protease
MRVRAALRTTGAMVLQALPVAVLLFLFFPRLPGQFWALPTSTNAATGLSDEMTPGDISKLTTSSDPAFRVKFDGDPPPPAERYWRGPVLHDFDGRRWRREVKRGVPPQEVVGEGIPYRYRITIEPTQRPWLFALDVPSKWPMDQSLLIYDLQLIARRPITSLESFELQSHTRYRTALDLSRTLRALDTALPAGANPRTRAFAQELRATTGTDLGFIEAVLKKFREEEFYYTLTPPLLGDDSVDDFLFRTRRGFCEHFASAFTTLMRAANIPARVVTGYQGGEYNALGDYLLIRQSDAHAWSEVWLADRGWERIDPTAAVAPQRIEQNLDAAISVNESVPGRFLRQSRLLLRVRLTWDAINNAWNDGVVEYNELKQRSLMAWLGIQNADWRALGIAFAAALSSFFVGLTLYLGWQYRPRARDQAAIAYEHLCRKLARVQLPREHYEGPVDYLKRASLARPQCVAALSEASAIYIKLRYEAAPEPLDLQRFKSLVRKMAL